MARSDPMGGGPELPTHHTVMQYGLRVGAWVHVQGLVQAVHLNGEIGIVIGPALKGKGRTDRLPVSVKGSRVRINQPEEPEQLVAVKKSDVDDMHRQMSTTKNSSVLSVLCMSRVR